jgi:hypothetical protein
MFKVFNQQLRHFVYNVIPMPRIRILVLVLLVIFGKLIQCKKKLANLTNLIRSVKLTIKSHKRSMEALEKLDMNKKV